MGKTVDARRLACPQPVILTKKAMEEGGVYEITTIVDNATALENVKKLASSQGYDTEVEERDGEFHIRMSRPQEAGGTLAGSRESVAVLITSNLLGKGDEELGGVLMRSFLYTLSEAGDQV
ncbi:MAG: sulfurtransferase TusA family protein, partial [Syntrophomonadaceae bacterium]|nr:sulfurtransferase TusA family protein [Syntrophomonadaceae bacterium]